MTPDPKAATERAEKMIATPRMFKADNLELAKAYLDLRRLAREVTDWPPNMTAKIKALRDALGDEP